MIKITEELFKKSIIAQKDDDDYEESGYVVLNIDNTIYLFDYSHCSCYSTFEVITDFNDQSYNDEGDKEANIDIMPLFEGSIEDFKAMAIHKSDLHMPERKSHLDDCDYEKLHSVYTQFLKWLEVEESK